MRDIAVACTTVIESNKDVDDYMQFFGQCFVRFSSNFGYDTALRATGRTFCDFLQNVDNIHMQMRFTYPRMRSPSMYLTQVDETGAVLMYRSTRTGFVRYLIGLLLEISNKIYGLELGVTVLQEDFGPHADSAHTSVSAVQARLRLNFDNSEYMVQTAERQRCLQGINMPPVSCSILFRLFPFGMALAEDMTVKALGDRLVGYWGHSRALHQPADQYFHLRKPRDTTFHWTSILQLQFVMFEVEVAHDTQRQGMSMSPSSSSLLPPQNTSHLNLQSTRSLLLRGQMRHLPDINAIVFLCSPVVDNLDELQEVGLCINDLNMHGLSREMILAGWQHCSRYLFNQNFTDFERHS